MTSGLPAGPERRAPNLNVVAGGANGNGIAAAPVRVTALTVARRLPFLMILPVAMLLGAGIAAGFLRAPTFTATSNSGLVITVKPGDAAALGSVTEAVVADAATYSRAVTADAVVAATARATGIGRATVAASVSATPVPASGDITVRATARSGPTAVRLANAAVAALARYVRGLSVGGPSTRLVIFARAATASSDRRSRILLFGILGLIAGLVVGYALCAWQAMRVTRASRARLERAQRVA